MSLRWTVTASVTLDTGRTCDRVQLIQVKSQLVLVKSLLVKVKCQFIQGLNVRIKAKCQLVQVKMPVSPGLMPVFRGQ